MVTPKDNPNFYHGDTAHARVPTYWLARLDELSMAFGQSRTYWMDRLLEYGYTNEPDLRAAIAARAAAEEDGWASI